MIGYKPNHTHIQRTSMSERKQSFREKIKPGLRPLPPGLSMSSPVVLIATWFGAGRLRPASGTIGTLAALPVGVLIQYYTGMMGLAIAAVALFIIGTIAAEIYGRKSGNPDDQAIVVDEAVGLWIAALPAEQVPILWVMAFIFFRIFDVCKPWPASFFEKRKGGGLDTMMDDVVAGFFAFLGVAATAANVILLM